MIICNKYNEENKFILVFFVDCEFLFKICICLSLFCLSLIDLLIMILFYDFIIFIYGIIICNNYFYIIMILLYVIIIFIMLGNREKDLFDGIGFWYSFEI